MVDMSLCFYMGYDIGAVALCVDLFYWFTTADSIAVLAGNLVKNGINPRLLNISGLLPPASSSPFDSVSTQLPPAPADYCGLCIIEAPGGIRLVYWVCILGESFLFGTIFKSQDTFRISNYLTHFLTVQLLGVRPSMVSDPEQKTLIALHVVTLLVLWL